MPTKTAKDMIVSREPRQPMGFMDRFGGRKTDIQLPADESQMDPKLRNRREALRSIPASLEQLRKLGKR